jgi:glycogen debranching enzyme
MTTPAIDSAGEQETKMNSSGPNPHSLLATSSLTDAQTRILKHGDTFAVFDRYGDATPGGLGELGLYHESTRYLSCSVLELDGQRPFFLSSTVHDDNDRFEAHLTNPDLLDGDQVRAPLGMLHLGVEKFLWQAACYQQLRVSNYGREPVSVSLRLRFGADYADIFEVRGQRRAARGRSLRPEVCEDRVILGYRGLDDVLRRTILHFAPAPAVLIDDAACWELTLVPGEDLSLAVAIEWPLCVAGHGCRTDGSSLRFSDLVHQGRPAVVASPTLATR